MPFQLLSIRAVRPGGGVTATFGVSSEETVIPGSPFPGRIYRVPQTTVKRDEATTGTATTDQMRRAKFDDPHTPLRKGDILYIPSDDDPDGLERATVLKVRRYDHSLQCDLETGVERMES